MKHAGLFIALVIAMQACSPLSDEQRMEIDRCNDRAYHDRYVNIDSTMFYEGRTPDVKEPLRMARGTD